MAITYSDRVRLPLRRESTLSLPNSSFRHSSAAWCERAQTCRSSVRVPSTCVGSIRL